jgi:ATPase subunit of ABC transporter with duplicated ATPase domains
MLTANSIAAAYENGPLFEGLDLTLNPGDRVGVVGPNGAGKSTLLRTLNGDLPPQEGHVASDSRIGYLAQLPDFEEPVTSYVDRMSNGVLSMEQELHSLYPLMGTPDIDKRVGTLQGEFEARGGWDFHARVSEVFSRLGVPEEAHTKSFGELSGGQQSRVLLAGQLIQEPDILLLDEPTNNLDSEALDWLEGYLSSYKGALVVVSHDRAFLDHTVSKVIEIDGTGGEPSYYEGGYTAYRDEKAKRLARQLLDLEAQDKKENALQDAMTHLRRLSAGAGSTRSDFYRAKAAKLDRSRVALQHRLDRMRSSDTWVAEPEERRSLPMKLTGESRRGRRLIAAHDLQLGYDTDSPAVIEDASFTVRGKDRVAIVGNNGAGKSTLLRAIAGNGELVRGGSLDTYARPGYLSQTETHAVIKQSDHSVVEWYRRAAGPMYEDEAASMLVWFGFDKKQIWQPASKLSPGETNKLGLLGMTFSGNELLLFDEPTNHLDFDGLDIVEDVLSEFKGTIVTVSHDRQFLGNIACNRLFKVAGGRVTTTDL